MLVQYMAFEPADTMYDAPEIRKSVIYRRIPQRSKAENTLCFQEVVHFSNY